MFGFSALEYVKKPFTVGFFSGINLMAAVAAFVLVWAYQKKVEEEETLASWAVFFCVAVSFSVFGFSTWNPQWVLLMAPFLVLNVFMNENGNLLLMITNIFMLAMYIFCSQEERQYHFQRAGMADPRGVSLWRSGVCASDVCLCDGRSAGQNSLL